MSRAQRQLQRAAGLLQQGNIADAAELARAMIDSQAADDPMLRVYLADLCLQCEMYFDAAGIYEEQWPRNPDDPSTRYKAGTAAYRIGKLDAARDHFLKCVEVRPDTAASYLQLGHVYRAQRRFADATQAYLDYIARSQDARGHGYWSLVDLRNYAFDDEEVDEMRRHLERCPPDSGEASLMQFALGNIAERRQSYDEALRHYRTANNIQRQLRPFRHAAYQGLVDGLLNAELQPAASGAALSGKPIFIVGLPRSGTTLVEQILAAHSLVEATDELPYIERIAYRLERSGGYGTSLATMDEATRNEYRASYLADARRYLAREHGHFVDKNPNNFLHIGLIRTLFPEALIINVRRDLRDNALSMYRQFFNVGHDHSASFTDMAIFFDGYLRLMHHWLRHYPESIRVQGYEDLVQDPHEQIPDLLRFCGLPHEEGCVEFHRSKAAVMTPSAAQVSQPMYTSSIGCRKHFEKALEAEFEQLDVLQQQHGIAE